MKLELKHLIGYLPYGLNLMIDDVICEIEGVDLHKKDTVIAERVNYKFSEIKPILRPLSDLTKEIEVDGDVFIALDIISSHLEYELNYNSEENEFSTEQINRLFIMEIPYLAIDCMLEWYFDIYGLIENDLAIDINTLR